uniref:Putative secreted protein n=1 Tax=Anopheles darlingi TaxID=43151 RepID=A0A2M4D2A0_ANODA
MDGLLASCVAISATPEAMLAVLVVTVPSGATRLSLVTSGVGIRGLAFCGTFDITEPFRLSLEFCLMICRACRPDLRLTNRSYRLTFAAGGPPDTMGCPRPASGLE